MAEPGPEPDTYCLMVLIDKEHSQIVRFGTYAEMKDEAYFYDQENPELGLAKILQTNLTQRDFEKE